MQATGFVTEKQRSPIGIGGAVAIHAAVAVIYILTPKDMYSVVPEIITLARPIEAERDPDPLPPPDAAKPSSKQESRVANPKPEVNGHSTGPTLDTTKDIPFPTFPLDGNGFRDTPPAKPDPVLADARPDPRYLQDLQPDYPTNLQRMQMEGSVTVRVKIGTDGRVKAVQLVSATHDDFYKVTERQALRRWRFKPATRDGQPVESWREMTVHFRLEA